MTDQGSTVDSVMQVLPDDDLYRATLPDDPDIIEKPLRAPRRAPRALTAWSGHPTATDLEMTAVGRPRAPQGQSMDLARSNGPSGVRGNE